MIVATAGHVDHGKTLLIRALTGVDTDRLPEEKQRGMTIDLGFAYWRIGGGLTIGFVDVPGHERFIRNMLCGVAGVDFALLVVAADDGVMPQTREHVAILDLLGMARGAVALTKIDRVAPDRVEGVAQEVRALLTPTALRAVPLFPVSAATGDGIAALSAHLQETAQRTPPRPAKGNFRLAIDRAFTIAGAGLVVTGAIFSGAVAVGDTVRVLGADRIARVRALHAQNREERAAQAGERCALNLSGADLTLEQLERGDWITGPDAPAPVKKFDARLRLLPSEARALAHWTPVHLHLGAADVTGRVALLEGDALATGETGLVQLVLDRPLGAVRGDRFILRDQSARRTIAGGVVIDIFPPPRGRARPERLLRLRAMEHNDHPGALNQLLDRAPAGLDLGAFAQNCNLTPQEANALFAAAGVRIAPALGTQLGFSPPEWQSLKSLALAALAAWHRRAPDRTGLSEMRLFAGAPIRIARDVAIAIVAELVKDGAAMRSASGIHLPQHRPLLAPADVELWRRVEPLLEQQPVRPPTLHELAAALGEDPKKLEAMLVRALRFGQLVRVAPNRFYRPDALRRLAEIVASLGSEARDRRVTAAGFRDRAGVGRNLAIELLEYFDRIKFTRRVGDAHEVVGDIEPLFAALPPPIAVVRIE